MSGGLNNAECKSYSDSVSEKYAREQGERKKEIEREMDLLEDEINKVSVLASHLKTRFNDVLSEPPDEEKGDKVAQNTTSPLATRIRLLKYKVEVAVKNQEEMFDRCELEEGESKRDG